MPNLQHSMEPIRRSCSKWLILRKRKVCLLYTSYHGFHCTVLFAINPKDGTIDPNQLNNIPGLEALDSADLMVILTRFRDLPDDQMKHIVDYVESGKPIVGIRTATHAFQLKSSSTYAKYSWNCLLYTSRCV